MPQTERFKERSKSWACAFENCRDEGNSNTINPVQMSEQLWSAHLARKRRRAATHRKRAALEHAGPPLRIVSLAAVSCSASRRLVCRRLLTTMPAWLCITFPSWARPQDRGLLSASLTLWDFCLRALQLAVPLVCKACFQILHLICVSASVSLPPRQAALHLCFYLCNIHHYQELPCLFVFLSISCFSHPV